MHFTFINKILLALIAFTFLVQCESNTPKDWKDLIPEESILLYKSEGENLSSFVSSDASAFIARLGIGSLKELSEKLTLTYLPTKLLSAFNLAIDASHWEMVLLLESSPELAESLHTNHTPENGSLGYNFIEKEIYRVLINGNEYFISSLDSYSLVSRSSQAIEACLLAENSKKTIESKTFDTLSDASWAFNVSELGLVIRQNVQVKYRDLSNRLFERFGLGQLRIERAENLSTLKLLTPLKQATNSALSQAITYENSSLKLGDYISSNAAHFSLFRNSPLNTPINYEVSANRKLSSLDSALVQNDVLRSKLIESLGIEFGIVTFSESGFLEQGEYLWLRHLKNPNAFYQLIERLKDGGLIQAEDDLYYVHSYFLAELLSSGMATTDRFFLNINYEAAVMAERIGLCKSVGADRSRRRVFTYDASWKEVRSTLPETFSSLHVARSKELNLYLQRFLRAGNYISPLFEEFDRLLAFTTFELEDEETYLKLEARLIKSVSSYIPYEENWLFPLFNENLTGPIVYGNLVGSERPEIVFSTDQSKVYVIASDGTLIREMKTQEGDIPIGGPIIYDWYGNGLKTVLVAAGNKIYGWDNQGNPLPGFPIRLEERISAPIVIQDIRQNGSPEIIVTTDDRKLHVLDTRGQALRGWPVTLNATASQEANFKIWRGIPSIFVSAQNVFHAFLLDGTERPSYPIFMSSDLSTKPLFEEEHILLGDQSGAINTIGLKNYFSGNYFSNDTEIISQDIDSIIVNRLEFGATSIVGDLSLTDIPLYQPSDSLIIQEKRVLFQSFSGQLYLMNQKAEIAQRFEMGEFISENTSPIILKLYPASKTLRNHDHLLSLTSYGRLQGWDLRSGRRLISLPSSSMQFPLLIDLNNDGIVELISNASEGIRSWNLME